MQQFKAHQHNWQTTSRRFYGALVMLHVCTEHRDNDGTPTPVVKAYQMTIENPQALNGRNEFFDAYGKWPEELIR